MEERGSTIKLYEISYSEQMKKGILIVGLLLVMVASVFGCESVENSKQRPSDEELEKASTVCGIVREVSEETLKVQLCGNYILCDRGDFYIDIANEYEAMKEGDSVLLYYTGEIKSKEADGYKEVYNIEVCYMENYENDGQFVAHFGHTGGLVPDKGAVKVESTTVLTPLDDEPEENFYAVLSVAYYIDGREDPDNPGGWTDVILDVEDFSEDVIVTYDLDTMEVISITQ